MTDGYVGHWDGEEWVEFRWAANKIGDKLAIPPGPAQSRLRKLCASSEIRALTFVDYDEPKPIPPSRWRDENITRSSDVAVSATDLRNWLNQQSTLAAGGRR